jgi:RNA polymerase sigma-70 factor (ECF subfamily)
MRLLARTGSSELAYAPTVSERLEAMEADPACLHEFRGIAVPPGANRGGRLRRAAAGPAVPTHFKRRSFVRCSGEPISAERRDAATCASSVSELNELEAARQGDAEAFGALVAPLRTELHAHCYRMLGSIADAEDALQEALLRAWRGLPRFEGRSSFRSWLYTIATNACLRAIERRPKRILPIDYGPAADPRDGPTQPLVESMWLDPYPDEELHLGDGFVAPDARYERRESVELAFIAALQHLPARQRAVLILRDVIGFSAREVAEVLGTTPSAVDSSLQRAHKTADDRLPAQSQQKTLRVLGDIALRRVVDDFVAAWERGDVDAIVAMLAKDASISMPPVPSWYRGREAVAAFLEGGPLAGKKHWRLVPARANGQLALGEYIRDEKLRRFVPHGINVLTLRGARIAEITVFLIPKAFDRFGLPNDIQP